MNPLPRTSGAKPHTQHRMAMTGGQEWRSPPTAPTPSAHLADAAASATKPSAVATSTASATANAVAKPSPPRRNQRWPRRASLPAPLHRRPLRGATRRTPAGRRRAAAAFWLPTAATHRRAATTLEGATALSLAVAPPTASFLAAPGAARAVGYPERRLHVPATQADANALSLDAAAPGANALVAHGAGAEGYPAHRCGRCLACLGYRYKRRRWEGGSEARRILMHHDKSYSQRYRHHDQMTHVDTRCLGRPGSQSERRDSGSRSCLRGQKTHRGIQGRQILD